MLDYAMLDGRYAMLMPPLIDSWLLSMLTRLLPWRFLLLAMLRSCQRLCALRLRHLRRRH